MRDTNLYTFDATVHHETELAWLLIVDCPGKARDKKVWVPKSQCENNGDGTFTMPGWLAEEKEIV